MSGDLPEWMYEDRSREDPGHTDDPSQGPNKDSDQASSSHHEQDEEDLAAELANLRALTAGINHSVKNQDLKPDRLPLPSTTRLQVSQAQLNHAALLERIIRGEGHTISTRIPREDPSQPFLRILFGLLILGALVWAYFSDIFWISPTPPVLESHNMQVYQQISMVQPKTPVLVVVDYTPSLSGEMSAIAEPVVISLAQKQAYLVFASTSTDGVAQAENLAARIRNTAIAFNPISHYANLGYISGGSAGLRAFGEGPRLAIPQGIIPEDVWNHQPLDMVEQVADFSMVVVIADQGDEAREWIEQIGNLLKGKPLIMVVSAQAEPLIRPYMYSDPIQIQGMIAGLPGGIAYSATTGNFGDNGKLWLMVSFGLLVGAVLILAGSIFSLALHFWMQHHSVSPKGDQS